MNACMYGHELIISGVIKLFLWLTVVSFHVALLSTQMPFGMQALQMILIDLPKGLRVYYTGNYKYKFNMHLFHISYYTCSNCLYHCIMAARDWIYVSSVAFFVALGAFLSGYSIG